MATTMCTGNLRSGTQNLCMYFIHRDKEHLKKALVYYECIGFFVIGAMIGKYYSDIYNEKAILIASALLFIAFIMMFVDNKKKN